MNSFVYGRRFPKAIKYLKVFHARFLLADTKQIEKKTVTDY